MDFKDYIIMRDYEGGWYEIFFFDHELTNGEVNRIQEIIQSVKDTIEDYCNDDVEEAIDKAIPFIKTLIISDTDDYHTVLY